MTIHRRLTFAIYACVIAGAIGHVVYLWPELTPKERVEICIKYGAVIAIFGIIIAY